MKSRIADVANARQVESEAEKAVCKIIEVILIPLKILEISLTLINYTVASTVRHTGYILV